jgi:hypothetical protein
MRNTVTQAEVDAQIVDVQVSTIFEKVTVVAVRLRNGFVLVESAGAVDKANYSEEVGKGICLQRIKNKIWELEGYRLSSERAEGQPLRAAAAALVGLVEGPRGERWAANGFRLKDTSEWASFYVAAKNATRA